MIQECCEKAHKTRKGHELIFKTGFCELKNRLYEVVWGPGSPFGQPYGPGFRHFVPRRYTRRAGVSLLPVEGYSKRKWVMRAVLLWWWFQYSYHIKQPKFLFLCGPTIRFWKHVWILWGHFSVLEVAFYTVEGQARFVWLFNLGTRGEALPEIIHL